MLNALSRPFKTRSLHRVISFIEEHKKEFNTPILEVRKASIASKCITPADIEVITPRKTLYLQVQPFYWLAKVIRVREISPVPLAIIVCNSTVSDDLLHMRIEEGLSYGYNRTA